MGRILIAGAVCAATAMLLCGPAFADRGTKATATLWLDLDRTVVVTSLSLEPWIADLHKLAVDLADNPARSFTHAGRGESPYFYAAHVWHGEKPQYHMLK